MTEHSISVFKNQKGGFKVNVNGFTYAKNREYNNKVYLECEFKRNDLYKCKARLTTNVFSEVECVSVISSAGEHNHEGNPVRASVARNVHDLKMKTKDQPTVKTCQILQNHIASTSSDVATSLPSKDSLRQMINRGKKKVLNVPKEPTNFDFVIDHQSLLLNDDNFVIKERIFAQNKRVIIFSTKECVTYLSQANYWLMDGTFKIVPIIFQQLYTIHGSVHNTDKTFPLLFVLCTHKDKTSYDVMFDLIIEYCTEQGIALSPSFVIMDFEKAAALSIRQNFEAVTLKGCFFHLRQILYRKIQKEGLSTKYNNDKQFNKEVKCLMALCYVHPDNVLMYFNGLLETLSEDSLKIANWFGENYIQGKNNQPPKYNPSFWCLNYLATIPRTQNSAESFHHHISQICSKRHVGFYRLASELIKETKVNLIEIQKIINGESVPNKRMKKGHYKLNNINNILQNIPEYNNVDLLRAIATNL